MSQAAYEFEPEQDGSTTEQVKDVAEQVVGKVQDTAQVAKEQAGDRLTRLVDERSTQGGEQVVKLAESFRQGAGSMREQGQDGPAKFAEQAADRVQALGLYLRDNDGNRILADVEDLARRQPLIVAAGAFALGFAGARFLKASAARRQESQGTTGPTFDSPPAQVSPSAREHGFTGAMGIGTAGAIATEPPLPVDPVMDSPTDFGAPAEGASEPDTAPPIPPTTSTP